LDTAGSLLTGMERSTMIKNRLGIWPLGFALGLTACSSPSDPDDGDGNGSGGPDSGLAIEKDSGGASFEGGVIPMPDGGLGAARDAACAGWLTEPEALPVVLEFVVDNSNSMNDRAPGSTRSKWAETRDALIEAIFGLPATTAVGMLLFPNMATGEHSRPVDSSECVDTSAFIPVALLGSADSDQRAAINQVLEDDSPNRNAGTPTDDAYRLALDEMGKTDLSGDRFIVLITDGQPTYDLGCVGNGRADQRLDPQPVIDDIAAAEADLGLRTFVIGSPGSEDASQTGQDFRPSLSEAAVAGRTAKEGCTNAGPDYCHFDMTQAPNFGDALRAALTDIAGQIVSCQYTVPPAPSDQEIDLDAVNVVYTDGSGQQYVILRNSADPCNDGWKYSNDNSEIQLCSDTCSLVKSDSAASLEVLFGCATETKPLL
jgi:hypothetical protein